MRRRERTVSSSEQLAALLGGCSGVRKHSAGVKKGGERGDVHPICVQVDVRKVSLSVVGRMRHP